MELLNLPAPAPWGEGLPLKGREVSVELFVSSSLISRVIFEFASPCYTAEPTFSPRCSQLLHLDVVVLMTHWSRCYCERLVGEFLLS
jgi:hypothetical protein